MQNIIDKKSIIIIIESIDTCSQKHFFLILALLIILNYLLIKTGISFAL